MRKGGGGERKDDQAASCNVEPTRMLHDGIFDNEVSPPATPNQQPQPKAKIQKLKSRKIFCQKKFAKKKNC